MHVTRAERDHQWYQDQIEAHGVEHPWVVWNWAPTREEAIDDREQLIERLNLGADERVIELGCGNLLVYDALLGFSPMRSDQYCGVEIVEPFLEYAVTRNVRVTPKIPADEKFDVGVIVGFFASLEDDREVHLWIKRMMRVVTKRLIVAYNAFPDRKTIFTPNFESLVNRFKRCKSTDINIADERIVFIVEL